MKKDQEIDPPETNKFLAVLVHKSRTDMKFLKV